MNEEKKSTVFITGATGHMGIEALKLLSKNKTFRLKLLSISDKHDRKILKPYLNRPDIEIIRGDLRNIDDVRRGVDGSDFVLHLGAIIPPAAEHNAELTEQINYGGTLNIIRAIREQPDADSIKLVYIATVAVFGNRPAPVHMARTGDPIKVSSFDEYGISKVRAERAVIESGLKYWVSLRQSGMLHKDMLKMMVPIIFHQPLDNHIEWSTAEDSGRVLLKICTMPLPDEFWRNIYNISSGSEYRETYFDFTKTLFARIGVSNIQKLFRPKDFALKNFHCVWYSDSNILNNWLHFRGGTYSGFLKNLDIPSYFHLLRLLPGRLIRKLVIEPLSRGADGTRSWIENNVTDRIKAFWGSRENWEKIPDRWEDFRLNRVPDAQLLEHGWDETLSIGEIDLEVCRSAAAFRGGLCLSETMTEGDIFKPLKWKCAMGHEFEANPYTVLRAGHWCPQCDTDVSRYAFQAAHSRFFAQVYKPDVV